MKKNVLKVLATSLVLGLAATNALADRPWLEKGKNAEFLVFVSQYPDTEIQKITVNRGSCPVITSLPKKLKTPYEGPYEGFVMDIETQCAIKDITEIEFIWRDPEYVKNPATYTYDMSKCEAILGQDDLTCFATKTLNDD